MLLRLSSVREALAAKYRAVISGLERNLAGSSALGTNSVVHFTRCSLRTAARSLTGIAAGLAALRFIGETFFGVESLLIGGEYELGTAIFASDNFVVVHLNTSNLNSVASPYCETLWLNILDKNIFVNRESQEYRNIFSKNEIRQKAFSNDKKLPFAR